MKIILGVRPAALPVFVLMIAALAGCGGGGGKTAPVPDLSVLNTFSTLNTVLLHAELGDLGYTNVVDAYGGIIRAFPKGIAIQERPGQSDLLWVANTYSFKIVHPTYATQDNFSMMAIIDLDTKQVIDYIQVKPQPGDIVFDDAGDYAYVIHCAESPGGYLSKIDAHTREVIKNNPICRSNFEGEDPRCPEASDGDQYKYYAGDQLGDNAILIDMVLVGDTAYISDRKNGQIHILNGLSLIQSEFDFYSTIHTTVDLPEYAYEDDRDETVDPLPVGLAYDYINDRLFIACYDAQRIYQYNVLTGVFDYKSSVKLTTGIKKVELTGNDEEKYYEYWLDDSKIPVYDYTVLDVYEADGITCNPYNSTSGAFQVDPYSNGGMVTYYCGFDLEDMILAFFTNSSYTQIISAVQHKNTTIDVNDIDVSGVVMGDEDTKILIWDDPDTEDEDIYCYPFDDSNNKDIKAGKFKVDPEDDGGSEAYYCGFENKNGLFAFYYDDDHEEIVSTVTHEGSEIEARDITVSGILEIKIAGVVCDPYGFDEDNTEPIYTEDNDGMFQLDPYGDGGMRTYYCDFDRQTGVLSFFHDSSHKEVVRGEILHDNAYIDDDDITLKGPYYGFEDFGSDEYPLDLFFDDDNQRLYVISQRRTSGEVTQGKLEALNLLNKNIIDANSKDSVSIGIEPMRLALSPLYPWVVVTERLPLVPNGKVSLVEIGLNDDEEFEFYPRTSLDGGDQPWDVEIASDGLTAYVSNIESQDITTIYLDD